MVFKLMVAEFEMKQASFCTVGKYVVYFDESALKDKRYTLLSIIVQACMTLRDTGVIWVAGLGGEKVILCPGLPANAF